MLHIFRKYRYPPQGRLLEILKERDVSKANIFKKNSQRVGRVLTKQPSVGGELLDIFWNNTLRTIMRTRRSIPDVKDYCFANFDG